MRKLILLSLCTLTMTHVSAQEKNKIHLKLIQPGIEYQFSIKNNLLASFDLGFGLINMSYNSEDKFETYISTFSNVIVKNVYNSSKVLSRNNSLLFHSGNYLGMRWLGYNKNVDNGTEGEHFNYAVGPVWGIQRYHKTFYYQFELGLGYHSRAEIKGVAPLARFCVGINIKKW